MINHDKIREILDTLFERGWSTRNCAENHDSILWETDQKEDAITKALSAITSELEKSAPRWVSVEERYPDKYGEYLVLDEYGLVLDEWRLFSENGRKMDAFETNVVCWLENLPTPPAKKEEV